MPRGPRRYSLGCDKYDVCGLYRETVSPMERLKRWARRLRVEVYALYLAYKDPRVPWFARAFAAVVVAYAFSPIDLIPDFVPVLGYLDDLVIIPLGIALVIRLVPKAIWKECLLEARANPAARSRAGWVAAAFIILLWLLVIIWLVQQFA